MRYFPTCPQNFIRGIRTNKQFNASAIKTNINKIDLMSKQASVSTIIISCDQIFFKLYSDYFRKNKMDKIMKPVKDRRTCGAPA